MPFNHFSVLMAPTFRCNADCEYCFENKTSDVMELADFELILARIVAYLQSQEVTELKLIWTGGEILTMPPEWLLRANDACREIAEKTKISIENTVQSNMIGYRPGLRRVISEMFKDEVGSSLDFPNLHRKAAGGTPETYNDLWFRRYQEAKEAGIEVGVIAVLNGASLAIGAGEFYSYYIEKLGFKGFQINTPYPGGRPTPAKRNFPLDDDLLSAFYTDLFDLWMREGRSQGVSITPFGELIHYFRTGENSLSCCFRENCADTFLGVSPKGHVAQCEGFAASYPEYVFGNILRCEDLADMMDGPIRKQFLDRPMRLMEKEDCSECEYLALCHGGCPVHAYGTTGDLFAKDPDCQSRKTLFRLAKNAATELDCLESTKRLEIPLTSCA
jgi:radical SAM protein with 4Fe4S-binding SPASM domain